MARKVTTLFIRDTAINLLVMKGTRVDKWASSPLEPGLVSQGLVIDEAGVADRVKQLFKETKVSSDKVITAVSGHDSLYRIVTMPELPEAVLPEAVRREVKRTIPTPIEDIYYSHQRIPGPKGQARIFLVSHPRNLTDALIKTLRRAGVRPHAMDLAPLALCRIPDERRAIIINVRLEQLEVMVMTNRIPEVVRRVSLPADAESPGEKLPLIAEEFARTVKFYNSGHLDQPLDPSVPVFVCGELAEAPDIWPAVVGKSGYSVLPLPSPVDPPEGFNPYDFMVNIGLALREVRSTKGEANFSLVDLNALPAAYVPPTFSILRVLIPVGIVVGLGLIVLALILSQNARSEIDSLRVQVADAERSVSQRRGEINTLRSQINSAGATGSQLRSTITSLQRHRSEMYQDLLLITQRAEAMPDLSLGTVNHSGSSITISGKASAEDAIYSYARFLRNSGRFSDVWIPSITGTGTQFSIELKK